MPNERIASSTATSLPRSARRAHGICSVEASTPTGRVASWVSRSTSSTVSCGEETAILEGAHDPERDPLLGQVLDEALAVEPHRPCVRAHQSRHHVEQGGLSRTVGADQAHDLAGLCSEVDPIDRAEATIGDDHALHVEPRRTACAVAGAHGTGSPATTGVAGTVVPRSGGSPLVPRRRVTRSVTRSPSWCMTSARPPGR